MNKLNFCVFFFVMILISGILCTRTSQARALQLKHIYPEEKEQITNTVRDYFEARYRSFNTLELDSFKGLIDETSKGNSFRSSEFDKLEIELNHARIYHLRYLQYEYFLDFNDISINPFNGVATVYVVEGHDVEFEISREMSKSGPIISKMRNLRHTIVLQKENNTWKIVSDNYEDYLWRLMKVTGLSKKDLIQPNMSFKSLSPEENVDMIETTSCSLDPDQSTYPYNRISAVEYAHQYAFNPNPDYYYYPEPYGDCTNFVNQAIYEGSGAIMYGSGTFGWYYNQSDDHSASWTDVGKLFEFITDYRVWPISPEGCDAVIDQAERGDVIQYNWKEKAPGTPDPNDTVWDHSAFIVFSQYDPTFHWVAGHSPEVDGYPYTQFKYDYHHPDMVTRFIHIVRLDGARIFIPLALKNVTRFASQMQNPFLRPYPSSLEESATVSPLPYPAPMESSEPSILSSYPEP
jgi:hypothetical protein